MEPINRTFEALNKEVRNVKILKKIEKKTGIEPGSVAAIIVSIFFSLVLFGTSPVLICEIQSILYPSYATIYHPQHYWYSYWLISSSLSFIFTFLPTIPLLYAIRFVLIAYISSPIITNSFWVHEYLKLSVYQHLKLSS